MESITLILRAMANEKRMNIMNWLVDPVSNFPTQIDGDLINDGVCVGAITDKINLKQPTVTSHMKILEKAGLVTSKKIKNWVFYKPDRAVLSKFVDGLSHFSVSGDDTK